MEKGKGMHDIDVLGLNKNNQVIAAQVSYTDNVSTIKGKYKSLLNYKYADKYLSLIHIYLIVFDSGISKYILFDNLLVPFIVFNNSIAKDIFFDSLPIAIIVLNNRIP